MRLTDRRIWSRSTTETVVDRNHKERDRAPGLTANPRVCTAVRDRPPGHPFPGDP